MEMIIKRTLLYNLLNLSRVSRVFHLIADVRYICIESKKGANPAKVIFNTTKTTNTTNTSQVDGGNRVE